jgi:phosphatidylinositol 4-kinase
VRKHADRVLLLAEMMVGSGVPCLRAGPRVLQAMRRRFHLACTEEACVELVLQLVGDSLDAWSSRSYDSYQKLTNGIL